MKKIILGLLFLGLNLKVFTLSAMAAADGPQIKYFGYYWGWIGIDQNGDYSNAMFVQEPGDVGPVGLANNTVIALNKLHSKGVKGIIDTTGIFYQPNPQDPWGMFTLWPDWQSRWVSYWSILAPHKDKILAFYPLDEPNAHSTRTDWWTVTARIKQDAPDIKIIELLDSSGAVSFCNGKLEIGVPPQVDWLSFDWYFCWDNPSCSPQLNEIIDCFNHKAATSVSIDGQPREILLIPDAYIPARTIPPEPDFTNTQNRLIAANEWYYQRCLQSSQCVGIFPFVWLTDLPNNLLGVSAMPILENYLKTVIAPRIVAKTTPIDIAFHRLFLSRFSDIFNYSLLVNNYGLNLPSRAIRLLFDWSGLISYYRMDEINAVDAVGDWVKGNDGNALGTSIVSGPADLGNARGFDGLDDSITLTNESAFDFEDSQPFSFSFWIKFSDSSGYRNIFYKESYPSIPGYFLRVNGSVLELVLVRAEGNYLWVQETPVLDDGVWKYIVVTYNGSRSASGIKFYVNGLPVSTKNISEFNNVGSILNNANPVIGGARSAGAGDTYFSGTIDELGIWNRALTSDEVKDLYNGGQGLQPN